MKILCAATKTQHSQINKQFFKNSSIEGMEVKATIPDPSWNGEKSQISWVGRWEPGSTADLQVLAKFS